jgi:hypothetical protein
LKNNEKNREVSLSVSVVHAGCGMTEICSKLRKYQRKLISKNVLIGMRYLLMNTAAAVTNCNKWRPAKRMSITGDNHAGFLNLA